MTASSVAFFRNLNLGQPRSPRRADLVARDVVERLPFRQRDGARAHGGIGDRTEADSRPREVQPQRRLVEVGLDDLPELPGRFGHTGAHGGMSVQVVLDLVKRVRHRRGRAPVDDPVHDAA